MTGLTTVTGLTGGTAYTFQIRAVNAAGPGAASDGSEPATPTGPPLAPTGFSATAGVLKAALAWANPSDTTITKYQYRQSADGGNNWSPDWTDIPLSDASTTSYEVTGLTGGTAYTFQVRAVNDAGPGAATDTVTVTPVAAAPLAPPDFSAIEGDESAALSWTAAADNGAPITKYQYQQDGGAWSDIPDSAPGEANALSFTVTGLTNGTEYTFKLRAVNSIGVGAETDSKTATPGAPPGAPSGLEAVAGAATVKLSWTLPGNLSITAYQFRQSADDGSTWNPDWTEITGSGAATFEYTVERLVHGIEYTFEIRAMRGNVAGPESSVTATLKPAKPVVTAEAGVEQVTLKWDDPNDVSITGYQVKQDTGAWTAIAGSGRATVEHTVTGLTNGTEYTFQIRAIQGTVAGTESDAVTTTPQGVPLAPTDFSATRGDASVLLSWTAANDNGSTLTKYQYQEDEGAWTDIDNSAPGGANALSFTVTGLTNGTEYTFKLRAVSGLGNGAETAERTATPVAAQAAEINLWSTTLTVGKHSSEDEFGYNLQYKYDSFVERLVRDGPWSARVSGREAPRAVGC